MFDTLKKIVHGQNIRLRDEGLVILTEGNASQISPDRRHFVIKPSGVPYDRLRPRDMVVVALDGSVIEGRFRPSSDTPTHAYLYRTNLSIGGIVHTHSPHATIFAQRRRPIPCYGTTHADAFFGSVPVTRNLTRQELAEYELNTGKAIAEILNLKTSPCVLAAYHGPFAFGADAKIAVDHACILEKVAMMAHIGGPQRAIPRSLLDKHHSRKHGKNRYYGQPDKE